MDKAAKYICILEKGSGYEVAGDSFHFRYFCFMNQAQLQALGVSKVIAKADLTEDQLNMYLSNPPAGEKLYCTIIILMCGLFLDE